IARGGALGVREPRHVRGGRARGGEPRQRRRHDGGDLRAARWRLPWRQRDPRRLAHPHREALADRGSRRTPGPGAPPGAPVIKYLGSKRLLVPHIVALARAVPGARTVLDLFTGTTRVAQGLKAAGFHVTANDRATYSEVLARTYVELDARMAPDCGEMLAHLSSLPGRRGYITRTFCEEARFFQPANGMRIDAMRAEIDVIAPRGPERAVLLTALLEAADRVDSTTGLQMAYLKGWAPRSARAIALRHPRLIPG